MKQITFAANETVVEKFSSYKKAREFGDHLLGKTPHGMKIIHRRVGNKWFLIMAVSPPKA